MKKILLLFLTMLALPIGMQADALRDSLPSNYGNWMNLTEGYTEDKNANHQKMEVAIDGNTIHLSWVEFTKQADNTYNVWYRRSLDLGKTWEDAKVIFKSRTDPCTGSRHSQCADRQERRREHESGAGRLPASSQRQHL